MKIGDLVRYTADIGDALGMGIILALGNGDAQAWWGGEVRGMPIRWISFEDLEVVNESR
jgi:hypothetical protein